MSRRRGLLRRWLVAVFVVMFVAGGAALAPAGVALADPAGPTDYLSEILAVEPPTNTIALEILGGDSFVQLTADPGTEVMVIGYRGEPYLWFQPDGTVLENSLSPTTYLNEERYGTEFPEFADPDAAPEWRELGADGRWSWHDHRAHLMAPVPPFGTSPGDRIIESVIPLIVDGQEVDVTVISTWQPEPSTLPLVIGAVSGVVAALVGWLVARRGGPWALAAAGPAAVAVIAGLWQYVSLPAETGPALWWWGLPLAAVVAAVAGALGFVRADRAVAAAVVAVAALVLSAWGWLRRDGLTAALVPSNAPNWFDRGATMFALVAGVGLLIVVMLVTLRSRSGTERDHATT